MSNPGYLPDWHVDIQAMFTKRDIFVFFFFRMSSGRGGGKKPTN